MKEYIYYNILLLFTLLFYLVYIIFSVIYYSVYQIIIQKYRYIIIYLPIIKAVENIATILPAV